MPRACISKCTYHRATITGHTSKCTSKRVSKVHTPSAHHRAAIWYPYAMNTLSTALRWRLYAINIVATLIGVVLVPLAPFAHLIVDGQGRIDGWFHERLFIALLFAYPFCLVGGVFGGVWLLRRAHLYRAYLVAALPLLCAALLVWTFIEGGVRLR